MFGCIKQASWLASIRTIRNATATLSASILPFGTSRSRGASWASSSCSSYLSLFFRVANDYNHNKRRFLNLSKIKFCTWFCVFRIKKKNRTIYTKTNTIIICCLFIKFFIIQSDDGLLSFYFLFYICFCGVFQVVNYFYLIEKKNSNKSLYVLNKNKYSFVRLFFVCSCCKNLYLLFKSYILFKYKIKRQIIQTSLWFLCKFCKNSHYWKFSRLGIIFIF